MWIIVITHSLKEGGTYVTIASPDLVDFSIVLETLTGWVLSWFGKNTPTPITNMTMENQPFDDVFPNEDDDFPASQANFCGGGGKISALLVYHVFQAAVCTMMDAKILAFRSRT